MATKQGMCKNCGSLIIFDDRNENCECIFCHCIFPGAEAVKILENPDDYTFANEEIAETSESTHFYATKVNPDMIESAVARDRAMKAKEDSGSIKPSDFEISPNDVKAPAKLKAILIGATALLVILIIAVAYPFYNSRKKLKKEISEGISVLNEIVNIDTSADEAGNAKGYTIYGQSCQFIKLAVPSQITEDKCKQLFEKYTDLRAEKADITSDKMKGVTMEIFVSNGIYEVTGEGGVISVAFTEDAPVAAPATSDAASEATTEATSESK